MASGTIEVIVNGSEREVPNGTTLAEFLTHLGLDPRMVVIEHNRAILRDRARLASLTLAPGDTLELVHFVGGG